MQFKGKLYVTPVTRNRYGEAIEGESKLIKCIVMDQSLRAKYSLQTDSKLFDLEVLARFKRFEHYQAIVRKDDLVYTFDDGKYTLDDVNVIKDFNSKSKYIGIYLKEKE